jgi:hypothetical protein
MVISHINVYETNEVKSSKYIDGCMPEGQALALHENPNPPARVDFGFLD